MLTTAHVESDLGISYPIFPWMLLSISHQKPTNQLTQLNHLWKWILFQFLGSPFLKFCKWKWYPAVKNNTYITSHYILYACKVFILDMTIGCQRSTKKIVSHYAMPTARKSGLGTQISSATPVGDEVCFISHAKMPGCIVIGRTLRSWDLSKKQIWEDCLSLIISCTWQTCQSGKPWKTYIKIRKPSVNKFNWTYFAQLSAMAPLQFCTNKVAYCDEPVW